MFEMKPIRQGIVNKKAYLEKLLEHMFDEEVSPGSLFGGVINVDVRETDVEYLVDADLPGFSKEAITVAFDNDHLIIEAKREDLKRDEGENYIRQERSVGEFRRRFYMDNVQEDKITAKFADGVLKLVLPKKEIEINKQKIIPIQ